jgi:predicted peptidase
MTIRRLTIGVVVAGLAGALSAPASATRPAETGIRGVAAITQVYTYGQKVAAVAVEYASIVNPRMLDLSTFSVSDTIYNFRYNPIEDLRDRSVNRADRSITNVYTNDTIALRPGGRSRPGRFVIIELAPTDPGGNTVIVSKCPTALCSVKVNPDQPTEVVQNKDVYALAGLGRGKVISAGSPIAHPLTGTTVNLLADDFVLDTFTQGGATLPYAYHLPRRYNPRREYPLVVILPGHGMGWDGDNLGVQVAADIPATAWLRPDRIRTREDVIVLAPQNQRVGPVPEAAELVELVDSFMKSHSVDHDRVYASTVSYGSRLAWEAMAARPGLFSAALITGGFQVSADQAARIAAGRTPIWITHGLNDHLLPVAYGRTSASLLRDAYVAAGANPAEASDLVRYTEYGNDAFSEPDYHAAFGPTYEDPDSLRWLLAQER